MHTIHLKLAISYLLLIFSSQLFAQYPEGLEILHQNLVTNGDFSNGNTGFQSAYYYNNHSQITNEKEYGISNSPRLLHNDFSACQDHSGTGQMMVINGSPIDNEIVWSQKIKVKKHTNYVFSCWIASAMSTAPAQLQFCINGKNHEEPILAPSTTCVWKQFSTLWESGDNDYITISIVNKNTIRAGNDFLLDDIAFYECIPPKKAKTASGYLHSANDLDCDKMLILDKVKFHDNSTNFKGMIEANQTLFLIFQYMKDNPNTTLTLYGHTDVFGSPEQNLELSKARVVKIQRWLSMYGIKGHRINYEWYGSTRPLVPEGDASNRRVEIKLSCGELN